MHAKDAKQVIDLKSFVVIREDSRLDFLQGLLQVSNQIICVF